MKKRFILVLTLSLILVLSAMSKTPEITSLSDLVGKVLGMVSPIASKEAVLADITRSIGGAPEELLFFNRTADGVTALMFGKIDAMAVSQISADFYLKRNPSLSKVEKENRIRFYVVMALRNDNEALRDQINGAIKTLEENGKLAELQDKWINNLPVDSEPSLNKIDKIEGVKTYYVGVSGDLAPLDYIAADGRAAGYNVALMSEISHVLNCNFEFVSVENQARFAALQGRKIDIIFCNYQGNLDFANELAQKNWISTDPYFSFDGACYLVKK